MTPASFRDLLLRPALLTTFNVCGIPFSLAAERFILAICIQESALKNRYQVITGSKPGPARGWPQFELLGVEGLLHHRASHDKLLALCAAVTVRPASAAIWRAIEGHDTLAIGCARLLIWTSPDPLPTEEDAAWDQYRALWRPGKPNRPRWASSWAASA